MNRRCEVTNFSYKISVCYFSPPGLANKERNGGGGGAEKETCAERQTNCLSKLPNRCSRLPPNKPPLFFFLKHEFPSHTHTHTHSPPFLPLSHYMYLSLVLPLLLLLRLLPTLPAPPPLLLSCSCFLFFSCYHGIAAFHM